MTGTFLAEPFITLLKRASHSGHGVMFMHDRMLMNCYDIDHDDDIGIHYVLHVPETEEYAYDFYQIDLIFTISDITTPYSKYKKEFEERRKSLKLKPKQASVIGRYEQYDRYMLLSFDFKLEEEVWRTLEIKIPYPIEPNNKIVTNVVTAYNLIFERLIPDKDPMIIDGIKENIQEETLKRVRVYYHIVEMDGIEILLPFMKSSFRTLNKLEQFYITIQKTNIKHVYLVTHTFQAKGLTDQYIMYVENFRE